ncbi:uncharacterized protein LOC559555 [Danio rerio]|uniref:Si:ch211-217k17.12 n=1 Tax=Danio rerio TaxID=7955 RepID=H0WEA5_DANRE|nr:uncharacterized protein LOC559555 [Danio rerio]|eukprot:XP_705441.2 uncharacterized protein si:ch211-217k17.12 [Danio rerio]
MATEVYPAQIPNLLQPPACGARQHFRGDPKNTVPVAYHPHLENTSHAVLQAQGPVSPAPKSFTVFIINGSRGSKIPVKVRSSYTVAKMLLKALMVKTDLNLIFNGKPVQPNQMLCDLQVKPGATFITYQKCHGG